MSFFKKLFGPSLNELAEREILAKKNVAINKTFQSKLKNWKPPVFNPPEKIDEYVLNRKYIYKDVALKVVPQNTFHFEFNMIGETLSLISEPDNIYDSGAILVLWNDKKLGYIPKTRLQDMIHDYQKHQSPIYSVISNVSIDEETEMITDISVFLGFYHNPFKNLENCEKISTNLVKTSKKDCFGTNRQENLLYASEGDFIDIEYDHDTESYIVYRNGDELGEISGSVAKKLLEYNSNCCFIGIINQISENSSDKYVANISVYLKAI